MANCVVCSEEIREDARFCPGCGAEQPKIAAPGGDDDPMLGRTIARNFKIESLLGVGGMGKVYKARQLSLDKSVVIKILHNQFRDDPQLVQRFQREAKAASRLNHPNSIQVIDFGQDEGETLFMAIEYLEGRDLFSVLQNDGPFSDERIARIMVQVCSALADAHEQHVIHRDLKPENIMVEDRRGQKDYVKVLDFGIAKIQDPEHQEGQALTQAGMVCGTPEFMSPEQARGLALDARSDLYALGVVSYQLATGELPFQADTPIGIVTKHILEEPTPPREVRAEISEGMQNIILKAMAKDANARFQSAVEMGAAFESLLYNGGFYAPSSASIPAALPPSNGTPTSVETHVSVPAPKPTAGGTMVLASSATPTENQQEALQSERASTSFADADADVSVPGGPPKWIWAAAAVAVLGIGGAGAFVFLQGGDDDAVAPVAPVALSEPPSAAIVAAVNSAGGEATQVDPTIGSPSEGKDAAPPNTAAASGGPANPGAAAESSAPSESPANETAAKKTEPAKDKKASRGGDKGSSRVSESKRSQAKTLQRQGSMLAVSTDARKRQEGYSLLKKALALDPTNPDPIQAIAMIHKQNGDANKACSAMRDYVKRKGLPRARALPLLKRMCKEIP